MAKKAKNASATTDPNITLAKLAEKYLEHMETDGKSVGTCFSYTMELKTAIAELGADTLVSEITPEQIDAFNNCPRVMKLRSGKAKAEPSFMKTRRVIRLALTWAAQTGLIERAPYSAKDSATPAPVSTVSAPTKPAKARKSKNVVAEPAAPEDATTPAA